MLMRVLACGGLGMLIWEGFTGKLMANGNIEVLVKTLFLRDLTF